MCRFSILSAVVLLCCATMAAAARGEDKDLTGDRIPTDKGDLVIHPVSHASFVMQYGGNTIYVDPVGGAKPFADLPKPNLVLVTHAHFDHFAPATLEALVTTGKRIVIVATKTVAEKIPETLHGKTTVKVLANGEKTEVEGIAIEAVPAYNTTPGREKFHPKGRDNGYVLTMGGKRIYVAGDTGDTAEMRSLKGIDIAFLPMNLPYTMSVQKAAEVIRQFRPKIVYPYHFRNGDGTKANLGELRKLVGEDSGVEIRPGDWYPEAMHKGTKLPYDTYSGYFVSNKFEPDAAESFVVIHDQEQFDKVFGVAFVMGDKSHRLPKDAFKSNVVLAAIKRGKAIWEYSVTGVTETEGVVELRYLTTSKKSDSATFACPLIVSVPKGKYTEVKFVENKKSVKTLSTGKK